MLIITHKFYNFFFLSYLNYLNVLEIIYISPNHEINFKAQIDVELQRKSLNFSRKEIIFSECFT